MNCPICTENNTEHVDLQMCLQNSDTSYPISQCLQCGSYYFDPIPTTDDLATHYSNSYNFYRGNNPKQFGRGQGFADVYLTPHTKSGMLLDVGCGAGDFLLGIEQQSNWKTTGIDINQNAIANASEKTGLPLIHGDIFTDQLNGMQFDCIHLRDVIEHVPSPYGFLTRAHELLAEDGFIYIRIPNGTNEIKPKLRNFKSNRKPVLTTPGHIFYISRKGFKQLVDRSGFKIESSFSFGLKNGLRNLGLFPIPKWRKTKNRSTSSGRENEVNDPFHNNANKAAHKFIQQERGLRRGVHPLYLEHIYLLEKK